MHDLDPDDDADDWEDDDGETVVVSCPSCGVEVYEDAERCPSCGDFIVHGHRPWEGRPRWWIVLGLLGIGAVIWMLLH